MVPRAPTGSRPRLIIVITAKGEQTADRLKILGCHNVLVMIPETTGAQTQLPDVNRQL